MIARWGINVFYLLTFLWPGFHFRHWQSVLRDFSRLITPPTHPEPVWQKMAQYSLNGIPQPVNIEEEGLYTSSHRQTMAEKNI